MLQQFFLKKHATVTLADSGCLAVELLSNFNYNIVIIDADELVSALKNEFLDEMIR